MTRQPLFSQAPDLQPLGGQTRLMFMVDALGGLSRSIKHDGPLRRRQDWIRAEVRCLMCGRLLGRFLGSAQKQENGNRSAGYPVAFLAFRPLDPPGRIVPFTARLRFRCSLCGGAGALDDTDVFSTYDEEPREEVLGLDTALDTF